MIFILHQILKWTNQEEWDGRVMWHLGCNIWIKRFDEKDWKERECMKELDVDGRMGFELSSDLAFERHH